MKNFLTILGLLALLGLFTSLSPATAQVEKPPASPATDRPSPSPSPAPASSPSSSPEPATAPRPQVSAIDGHLELDNSVRVRVEHLAEWAINHDLTKLIPYINGRAIRGNYPEDIQAGNSQVHFHLE